MRSNCLPKSRLPSDRGVLDRPLLALLCSRRCPGDLILKAYDAVQAVRNAGLPVIGGFHSPVEADCLEILLRGTQPVVVCPARGIGRMRVKPAWKEPLAQGRLLLLSPFDDAQMRMTKELAEQRNRFVVDRAAALLVVHANPGGQTEAAARRALAQSKPVLTLPSPHNAHLVTHGAQPVPVPDLAAAVQATLKPMDP
ncbi:MAG: DNA-processing protein DprA [Chloroflexi bacterium]|nr:DNA-processing protein DprA [Chloroflexota bacterium]